MNTRLLAVYPALALLALGLAAAPIAYAAAPAKARAVPAASAPQTPDDAFLAARDAARAGQRDRLLALQPQLAAHPLSAYVDYWALAPRLRQSDAALDADLAAYFAKYPDSVMADRLRFDWLLALGLRRDFAAFERELPALVWNADDQQLRCYVVLARYARADKALLDGIAADGRRLLANARDAGGEGCTALADALITDGRLSAWERARALVEQNQYGRAKAYGDRLLDERGKPVDAKQLAQAIDKPAAFLTVHERRLTSVQRELAVLAIARLAREDPEEAARYASALNLLLTPEQRGIVWGRIGHMAALKLLADADDWYRRGGDKVGTGPDAARVDEVLEWQVRAALRAGDWRSVQSTIERMPPALRKDPAWVYWYGRALRQQGRAAEANEQFAAIAGQFHFYGKLASEELGKPVVLPPRAPEPTADELLPMLANPGFARALKLYELGMRVEGNREWNWQLRTMDDRQLLAAAEFARKKNVLDRMINTSDRTQGEFDFTQRFPSPHRDELTRHASAVGIDANWVYGLIRQESRFIQDAKSSVGASGLMQLMPATARYVAKRMNVADYSPARVNELPINLQLGTGYLRMVLDDLDGHPVLATAAYNAGPGRPRAWRASLARPVEGAIFAETIPFNETRDYVKKVMSNTVLYAALATDQAPSLKQRLGTIAPKAATTTELP